MNLKVSPVAAIFGVFFMESAVLGNWIPRIPDIKQNLSLSDSALGLCLLAIPLGTILGLMVASKLIDRLGLRRSCQVFLTSWAFAFLLPPFAWSQASLMVVLFFAGVLVGLVEVAMNTEADRLEQHLHKRIMSRCHGFWSLGSMVGALMGAALAHVGLTVGSHFLIVMPVLGMVSWWVASQLPKTVTAESPQDAEADSGKHFSIPTRAIVLLCMLPIGAMVVEGAFIDWSAVFVSTELQASPLVIGIVYAFFSIVMATVRMCGDWLGDRFSAKLIVQVSGAATALGITIFALSPNVLIAMLGAAISGMGVAIVYPLAMTAAARRPGKATDNVAALTMIGFSAFLLSPPIIGFMSDWFGLRIALLALAPVALTTALLANEVVPRVREGEKAAV